MRLVVLYIFLFIISIFAYASTADDINRLREAADSLHSVGRTDSAAIVGAQAVQLALKQGDALQIVGARSSQGVYLRSLGRIEEALESYEQALQIVTSDEFRRDPSQ
ncbi:MAG: tetratricopeptide repeat protein [Duncaniella sp.]|nr:tetratricopeptide repeat protein [Duncaniella sp.]